MNIVTRPVEHDPNSIYLKPLPEEIIGVVIDGKNEAFQLAAGLGASAMPPLDTQRLGILEKYSFLSRDTMADASEALRQQARLLKVLEEDQSDRIGIFTLLAADRRAGEALKRGVKVAQYTELLNRAQKRPRGILKDIVVLDVFDTSRGFDMPRGTTEVPTVSEVLFNDKIIPKEQFELDDIYRSIIPKPNRNISDEQNLHATRYDDWMNPDGTDVDPDHKDGDFTVPIGIDPWKFWPLTTGGHQLHRDWSDPSAEPVVIPDAIHPPLQLFTEVSEVLAYLKRADQPPVIRPDDEIPRVFPYTKDHLDHTHTNGSM